MSEWKSKSDFEINKAVAEMDLKFKSCIDVEFFCNSYDRRCVDVVSQGLHVCSIDYCNNPSDAWPIIIENKISINNGMTLIPDVDYKWNDCWLCGNGKGVNSQCENPLRAAMIVYLEMNGVKP